MSSTQQASSPEEKASRAKDCVLASSRIRILVARLNRKEYQKARDYLAEHRDLLTNDRIERKARGRKITLDALRELGIDYTHDTYQGFITVSEQDDAETTAAIATARKSAADAAADAAEAEIRAEFDRKRKLNQQIGVLRESIKNRVDSLPSQDKISATVEAIQVELDELEGLCNQLQA